jgi:hypothetical protein
MSCSLGRDVCTRMTTESHQTLCNVVEAAHEKRTKTRQLSCRVLRNSRPLLRPCDRFSCAAVRTSCGRRGSSGFAAYVLATPLRRWQSGTADSRNWRCALSRPGNLRFVPAARLTTMAPSQPLDTQRSQPTVLLPSWLVAIIRLIYRAGSPAPESRAKAERYRPPLLGSVLEGSFCNDLNSDAIEMAVCPRLVGTFWYKSTDGRQRWL